MVSGNWDLGGNAQVVWEGDRKQHIEVFLRVGTRESKVKYLQWVRIVERRVGDGESIKKTKANLVREGLGAALGLDGAAHHQSNLDGINLLARRVADLDVDRDLLARREGVLRKELSGSSDDKGEETRMRTLPMSTLKSSLPLAKANVFVFFSASGKTRWARASETTRFSLQQMSPPGPGVSNQTLT